MKSIGGSVRRDQTETFEFAGNPFDGLCGRQQRNSLLSR